LCKEEVWFILKARERKKGKGGTTMLRYTAGSRAGKGTYWNFSTGERIDISDEGILPSGKNTIYFRLPASGIIILGPVVGLLYAAFLPFIGIAILVKVVLQKVASMAFGSAKTSAAFDWRPSESYLAGKKKEGETTEKETEEDRPDN
jgi:hypothetical protein